jgi:FkbM family methyltransferase
MINKILKYIFQTAVTIIDFNNKQKVIKFFKKELTNKSLTVIDVGAHKGETINLFLKNFVIKKIIAFEANPIIFDTVKKKYENKKFKNKIFIFNIALGKVITQKYFNIIKESSSSTFNRININSEYYRKKSNYLSFIDNKKNLIEKKILLKIIPLRKISIISNLPKIDILKIDTEGYEFNILKGLTKKNFKKIKYIYLEHHYDLMIKKNYKYSELSKFLNSNNFYLKFKIKMKFRKTFEYIFKYEKKKIS